jgi:protein-tyrosine-phosphatase
MPKKIVYATQMTKQMIKEYDHIVCMTRSHKFQIDPKGFWTHVFTMDNIDVADPWGESIDAYVSVCKHLQDSIKKLYFKLCRT